MSVAAQKLEGRDWEGKTALSVVEAEPASSRLPAVVDLRISTNERRAFGASVPSSTRASLLLIVRAGNSTKPPSLELVQLIVS